MARVLIVDDDQATVRLLSMVLSSEQIDVEEAFSGEEALTYINDRHAPPDLILLDLAMPGMGGKEFFRKARGAGYDGAVVFCSSQGAASANRELGGQGAIDKPFDPDTLLEVISELVSERSTGKGALDTES